MTFIELGLITCFIGFLASSVLCAKSIYSKSATNSKAILLISVLSTAIQLVIARQALYIDNQIHLSLASMSLLIAGLINQKSSTLDGIKVINSTNHRIGFVIDNKNKLIENYYLNLN